MDCFFRMSETTHHSRRVHSFAFFSRMLGCLWSFPMFILIKSSILNLWKAEQPTLWILLHANRLCRHAVQAAAAWRHNYRVSTVNPAYYMLVLITQLPQSLAVDSSWVTCLDNNYKWMTHVWLVDGKISSLVQEFHLGVLHAIFLDNDGRKPKCESLSVANECQPPNSISLGITFVVFNGVVSLMPLDCLKTLLSRAGWWLSLYAHSAGWRCQSYLDFWEVSQSSNKTTLYCFHSALWSYGVGEAGIVQEFPRDRGGLLGRPKKSGGIIIISCSLCLFKIGHLYKLVVPFPSLSCPEYQHLYMWWDPLTWPGIIASKNNDAILFPYLRASAFVWGTLAG